MQIGSSNDANAVKEQYKQADIQDLPFEDSSFDVVIAHSMLYHVPDLVEYLRSLSSFKDIMDLPVEKIRKVLSEHIKDGAIDLPKDYGMFISK